MEKPYKPLVNASTTESLTVLSQVHLDSWTGDLSIFGGLTNVYIKNEHVNQPWKNITCIICPENLRITTDKKSGDFFLPCSLKEAPLIGDTLENAEKH